MNLTAIPISALFFALSLWLTGCASGAPSESTCRQMALEISDPQRSVEARHRAARDYLVRCLPSGISLGEALKTRSLDLIVQNNPSISTPGLQGGTYDSHTSFLIEQVETADKIGWPDSDNHILLMPVFPSGTTPNDEEFTQFVSITLALDAPVPQSARGNLKSAILSGALSHLRIIGWGAANYVDRDLPSIMYRSKFYSLKDLEKFRSDTIFPR
jgi:hypothetical protein